MQLYFSYIQWIQWSVDEVFPTWGISSLLNIDDVSVITVIGISVTMILVKCSCQRPYRLRISPFSPYLFIVVFLWNPVRFYSTCQTWINICLETAEEGFTGEHWLTSSQGSYRVEIALVKRALATVQRGSLYPDSSEFFVRVLEGLLWYRVKTRQARCRLNSDPDSNPEPQFPDFSNAILEEMSILEWLGGGVESLMRWFRMSHLK